MANCLDPSEWRVVFSDDEGTVSCGNYLGRFRFKSGGIIQIAWERGPKPGPNYSRLHNAAREACYRALGRR